LGQININKTIIIIQSYIK